MQYYKTINDDIVTSIGTINVDGDGSITEFEYNIIHSMLIEMPSGKRIRDHGDGTYSYEDAPPMPEPEPTDEDYAEVGKILMGVES